MEIRKIDSNKLDYKDLLLEADPEIEVVKEYNKAYKDNYGQSSVGDWP